MLALATARRWGTLAALVAALALFPACGAPLAAVPSPAPAASDPYAPPGPPTAVPSPIASPTVEPSPSPSPPPPSPSPPPPRSIRISLSSQHLWAYEGTKVIVSTAVTTGMPALPTPTGRFAITAKYSPYEFISPWPKGSPYYYDPLWVDYAMLFAAGGYFIHDAWWQRNFGPGGNLKTGSHGCVNVPPAAMPALYRWARIGDSVVIVS